MTYARHWCLAMRVATQALAAGFAAAIHAFLPFLFEHTASRQLRCLLARLEGAHRGTPDARP